MSAINEEITKAQDKLKQLKRQKRLEDNSQKKKQSEENTLRNILIGELVTAYFPEASQLNPHGSRAEVKAKFAILEACISLLAQDSEYMEQLKETAKKKISHSDHN